jgi:hypothetical protein
MAGDDLALLIDEHGVAEAKPLDALGDLPNLLLGVRAGVALVRVQCFDREGLDMHITSYPFKAPLGDARNELKPRDPAAAPQGSAFAQSEDCAF